MHLGCDDLRHYCRDPYSLLAQSRGMLANLKKRDLRNAPDPEVVEIINRDIITYLIDAKSTVSIVLDCS